jgi:hypothetical protein
MCQHFGVILYMKGFMPVVTCCWYTFFFRVHRHPEFLVFCRISSFQVGLRAFYIVSKSVQIQCPLPSVRSFQRFANMLIWQKNSNSLGKLQRSSYKICKISSLTRTKWLKQRKKLNQINLCLYFRVRTSKFLKMWHPFCTVHTFVNCGVKIAVCKCWMSALICLDQNRPLFLAFYHMESQLSTITALSCLDCTVSNNGQLLPSHCQEKNNFLSSFASSFLHFNSQFIRKKGNSVFGRRVTPFFCEWALMSRSHCNGSRNQT